MDSLKCEFAIQCIRIWQQPPPSLGPAFPRRSRQSPTRYVLISQGRQVLCHTSRSKGRWSRPLTRNAGYPGRTFPKTRILEGRTGRRQRPGDLDAEGAAAIWRTPARQGGPCPSPSRSSACESRCIRQTHAWQQLDAFFVPRTPQPRTTRDEALEPGKLCPANKVQTGCGGSHPKPHKPHASPDSFTIPGSYSHDRTDGDGRATAEDPVEVTSREGRGRGNAAARGPIGKRR